MTKRQKLGAAAVLVLACILTYANGIGSDFSYDDKAIVRDNPRIRTPAKVSEIFKTSYFGGPRGTGTVYRPVLLLSYAVEWWIHGKLAEAFRAVNVLLHAGATLLAAALLLRIGIPPVAAFASALIFAVHPIHVEAVTSLVGRGELLAAVFSLLYLHLALRGCSPDRRPQAFASRTAAERVQGPGPGDPDLGPRTLTPLALSAALLCYALAILTKESAASAPGLLFLVFLFVGEGRWRERLGRATVRGLPVLVGSAAVLAGVFLARRSVLGGFLKAPGTGVFEVENVLAPLDPLPRAVNACVILLRYIGRTFVPLHLSADESAWSIDVVSIASPIAIGAVLLAAALAVVSLARLFARSPIAFGFLFFCVALLPASNLLFSIGTVFAERLAYLPSAGLCLAAGSLAAGAAESWRALAPRRRAVLAALTLVLSARAVVRNSVWWGDDALFWNLVRTSPDSAKAHYDIAYVLADEKQYRRARDEYEEATELYEDYWDAWAGKGRMEKELGLYAEAEASYRKALEANSAYENGYFGLGLVYEARGDLARAEEIYRQGLVHKKDSLPLAFRLALARSRLGWPEALADWRRALALGSGLASVHEGFASWLARVGRPGEALHEAREALRRDPRSLPALRLVAELDSRSGRTFAEGLAREKIFRVSRSREDWERLRQAAEKNDACARRFAQLENSLAKLMMPGSGSGDHRP
ncbi:MAG TPA: tetratricopeptide repeat protein [Thermoanaerobaculia bacterium]|nr:tetratricopeptide repeat protein [Thermoanaerobaculia bacterium]